MASDLFPDRASTIVNPLAYHAIALWSVTRLEIQHAHLDQFNILLARSRYKALNWRQRLAKTNLVRKLLFALQTDWYFPSSQKLGGAGQSVPEAIGHILDPLEAALKAPGSFMKEDIKAIVAYLAANLHEGKSC